MLTLLRHHLLISVLLTGTAISACGTDHFVVAVIGSGGNTSPGTLSISGMATGGAISGGGATTSAMSSNGGSDAGTTGTGGATVDQSGGRGGTDQTGTARANGGTGPSSVANGGSGGASSVVSSAAGLGSTSNHSAGGAGVGTGGQGTPDTSVGGTMMTESPVEQCVCALETFDCSLDETTDLPICTVTCLTGPSSCQSGCPCTDSITLEDLGAPTEARQCTHPTGCADLQTCVVEYVPSLPYVVSRSWCVASTMISGW